jgi:P27 family predicted phage terminase small subunit
MGARGPLKLPAHLRPVSDREAAGTVAEEVAKSAPAKPEGVASDERLSALWDVIVPELDKNGFVTPADGLGLETMLRHYLVLRKAFDEVDGAAHVVLYDDKLAGGAKKHPAEQVFRSESDAFMRYMQQFGMTWMSRARTPAAKGRDDGDANPFAASASGV